MPAIKVRGRTGRPRGRPKRPYWYKWIGENRKKIVEIKRSNPLLTAREISSIIEVSEQYIGWVFRKEGLPTGTKTKKTKYCDFCKQHYQKSNKYYCSKACYLNSRKIRYTCPVCHKEAINYKSKVGHFRIHYCSLKCYLNRGK